MQVGVDEVVQNEHLQQHLHPGFRHCRAHHHIVVGRLFHLFTFALFPAVFFRIVSSTATAAAAAACIVSSTGSHSRTRSC